MNAQVDLVCPECGRHGPAPAAVIGRRIRCKACRRSFVAGPGALTHPSGDDPGLDADSSGVLGPAEQARSHGLAQLSIGLALLVLGVLITLVSYHSAAPNGKYTVMVGAIGIGVFNILVGAVRLLLGRM